MVSYLVNGVHLLLVGANQETVKRLQIGLVDLLQAHTQLIAENGLVPNDMSGVLEVHDLLRALCVSGKQAENASNEATQGKENEGILTVNQND